MILPPPLKIGDTIGIAATARKVSITEIADAQNGALQQGFRIKLSPYLFNEMHQFAGTDAQRAEALNTLIHDPEVKAIWCARGGYGSVRLLELIDWGHLQNNPKWLCGFSDVTALHCHIQQNLGMASLHCEMMLGYRENENSAHESFFAALLGKAPAYHIPNHALNKHGRASGKLIGGNLSVLYSLLGSQSQPNTQGAILFLEDLDEYLYHVDRMMMALHRAGILSGLAGLVVGGLTAMKDNNVPFGKTAEEIMADVTGKYNYPVCYNFPAGHVKNNQAIILGATTNLVVGQRTELWQNWA